MACKAGAISVHLNSRLLEEETSNGTNQFAGFPNSCNGSKTCPGKCSCLLDRQMGQANTGNHFLIGFRDLGECDVHSSFTDLLIRVSCVSVATAGYLELQSASSQSARKRDRNE